MNREAIRGTEENSGRMARSEAASRRSRFEISEGEVARMWLGSYTEEQAAEAAANVAVELLKTSTRQTR